MKTVETERLILRQFTVEDIDPLYAYASKLNIGPSAGWKPHDSREESLCIIATFLAEDNNWAILEKRTGKLIGSIGLNTDVRRNLGNDAVRNMGYVLDDTAWGKGYATEAAQAALRYAFEEMGLMMVSAQHYPFNRASKRVIEKCDFRYEGTLRFCARHYSGLIYDCVCYSMLREEFFERYGLAGEEKGCKAKWD